MPTAWPDLEFVVRSVAQSAVEHERYFCELDSVVGDGDFGYSLARGFEVVLRDWDGFERTSPAVFLRKIALVISQKVGGTSGPLWGTAALRAAAAAGDADSGTRAVAMLRAAAEGIKARGKAELGDKTLLDALVPMADAVERRLARTDAPAPDGAELARVAADTARAAAEATTALQARRGRASYTGERSIGSPDAGAVAVAVMAERIADTWKDRD
ncbi:MAG TPA: dihydroxyacetone kinase subunit DhaL [Actinocrinis sp.]|nr:dihydroxyacetone kinase subunit DhaL [Actinocrinis sp.]